MKPTRIALFCLTALLMIASSALAATKGSTMLGIQLTSGTADLYDPTNLSSNYISAFDHSEVGAQAQLWHFVKEDCALTVSAGMGTFNETDKPGNNPPASAPDFKYTQSSFNFRLGVDHVLSVGDDAMIYFGPGFEYWSGKAKFDGGTPASTVESDNTTRLSLSGRLGVTMMMHHGIGANFQIGHKMGMASATDLGRKASWYASSFDAAGGMVFAFGK